MKQKTFAICIWSVVFGAMLATGICCAKQPIAGGESVTAVTKAEVVAAANFAVAEQETAMRKEKETATAKLTLVSIVSAKEQVVAGMNYRLKLKVMLDGKEKTAEAVVWWQAWNKETPYRLTSWVWQ